MYIHQVLKRTWLVVLPLILVLAGSAQADQFSSYLLPVTGLSEEQQQALKAGEIVRFGRAAEKLEGAQAYMVMNATTEQTFEMLIDYESFDKWMHGVNAITHVSRPATNVAMVGYVIDSPLRDVQYVLERWHVRPHTVRWKKSHGDLEAVYGGYDIRPYGEGQTLLHYYTFIDVGVWLPSRIKTFFTVRGLQKFMESVREETGRRYGP